MCFVVGVGGGGLGVGFFLGGGVVRGGGGIAQKEQFHQPSLYFLNLFVHGM